MPDLVLPRPRQIRNRPTDTFPVTVPWRNGEIDIRLDDGTTVRADVFERRDQKWSWSAAIVPTVPAAPTPEDDMVGDPGRVPGTPVTFGPVLATTQEDAETEAGTWIANTLRVLAAKLLEVAGE